MTSNGGHARFAARIRGATAAMLVLVVREQTASADEIVPLLPASPEKPAKFTLSIEGSPRSLFVDVYKRGVRHGSVPPVDRCRTPCSVLLEDGRYDLFVHATRGTFEGSRPIGVHGSRAVRVEPPSKLQRWGGISLAVAGSALLAFSAYTLARGHGCESSSGGCGDDWVVFPVAVGAFGLIAVPTGLILFADSFRFPVDTISETERVARQPKTFMPSRAVTLGFRGAF